jgi:SAM-dependent methyltransferase
MIRPVRRGLRRRLAALYYVLGGRRPWSRGYLAFRERFIANAIDDGQLLERFARGEQLPPRYGEFLDERVIEYPWLLSRLGVSRSRLLDAGSSLNHEFLLSSSQLSAKRISIVTLAPEPCCFWHRGVSYIFEDLRALPLANESFDEVVSISTLEHVGMNNLMYTKDTAHREKRPGDAHLAIAELRRVLRPGGKLYLTVPFGKPLDYEWFHQFDARALEELVAAFQPSRSAFTFFRYAGGWDVSSREACGDAVSFDIHATRFMNPESTTGYDADFAAASRALAAIELWK